MMDIRERRQAAAQAVIDRFVGIPYHPGRRDCVRMALHDLHHLRVPVPFLKGVRWVDDSIEETEPFKGRRGMDQGIVDRVRNEDADRHQKHVRQMGALSGARIMRNLGFSNLIAAVDALGLPRIAPAMAKSADLVALPSGHAWGALSVAVGNGRVCAYTDESPNAVIIAPTQFVEDDKGPCAWRTIDG